jgi:hypothetical protein
VCAREGLSTPDARHATTPRRRRGLRGRGFRHHGAQIGGGRPAKRRPARGRAVAICGYSGTADDAEQEFTVLVAELAESRDQAE